MKAALSLAEASSETGLSVRQLRLLLAKGGVLRWARRGRFIEVLAEDVRALAQRRWTSAPYVPQSATVVPRPAGRSHPLAVEQTTPAISGSAPAWGPATPLCEED